MYMQTESQFSQLCMLVKMFAKTFVFFVNANYWEGISIYNY